MMSLREHHPHRRIPPHRVEQAASHPRLAPPWKINTTLLFPICYRLPRKDSFVEFPAVGKKWTKFSIPRNTPGSN